MDSLVLEYLRNQGYNTAAAELDKQINDAQNKRKLSSISDQPAILCGDEGGILSNDASLTKKSLIEQLLSTESLVLSSISDDNSKDIYQKSYGMLRSWACNSLESIKAEIISLCFPIFVHCYISLIKRGQEEDARVFWLHWSKDHTDIYADELKHLSLLTSSQQLNRTEFINTNTFLKQIFHAKFLVRMSVFAYGLLETFLVQNDLILIASIINEKITIDTISKCSNNLFEPVVLEGYIPNPNPNGEPLTPLELAVPGRRLVDSNLMPPSTRDDPFYRNCVMYLV